jgi:hypothetical protein
MAEDWQLEGSVTTPMDEDTADLEARVRMKLATGQRLTPQEAAFFERMPADKGLRPRPK